MGAAPVRFESLWLIVAPTQIHGGLTVKVRRLPGECRGRLHPCGFVHVLFFAGPREPRPGIFSIGIRYNYALPQVCRPSTQTQPRLCRDCDGHAGAFRRRQHRHLFDCRRAPAQGPSVCATGARRGAVCANYGRRVVRHSKECRWRTVGIDARSTGYTS